MKSDWNCRKPLGCSRHRDQKRQEVRQAASWKPAQGKMDRDLRGQWLLGRGKGSEDDFEAELNTGALE